MIYIAFENETTYSSIVDMLNALYPEYTYCYEDICKAVDDARRTYAVEDRAYVILPHTGVDIFLYERCSSTQDIGKMLYHEGYLNEFAMVVAKEQSKGRGQQGHSWISSEGNVMATLCLPYTPYYMQSNITVLLGAFLVHFLRTLGIEAYNKWINDVILDGKKVAGILLEQDGTCILLGLGINLCSAPLLDAAYYESTYIRKYLSFPYSPVACMYAFSQFLQMRCSRMLEGNTKEQKDYIEQYLAYKGDMVYLGFADRESIYGELLGISEQGGVYIHHDGMCVEYTEGSLSISSI